LKEILKYFTHMMVLSKQRELKKKLASAQGFTGISTQSFSRKRRASVALGTPYVPVLHFESSGAWLW
jgi:hypothetical protein